MRVISPEPVSEKALVRKIAAVRSRARWTIGAHGIGWLIAAVCGLAACRLAARSGTAFE